jgi:hypothetical protein
LPVLANTLPGTNQEQSVAFLGHLQRFIYPPLS